jgi:hypothetical protein
LNDVHLNSFNVKEREGGRRRGMKIEWTSKSDRKGLWKKGMEVINDKGKDKMSMRG